jgi:aspartate aminotransferase-like enzyme
MRAGKKVRLLTPGPTPVPERVALAMAQPILHHRSKDFEALFERVRDGLKWLFRTEREVLTFAASGSGAMEGAVVNFLSPGDKAIVVDGGKFGERWWKICRAYGVEPIILKVAWGRAVDPADVEAALKANPEAKAVYVQASETSTGVAHPVKEIAKVVAATDAILVVDGITAVGVFDLAMDRDGIDVLVTGSQKALMLPPGLAMAAASEKAWKLNETATLPRFYFDWKRERDNHLKNQSAWTPAVSLLMGLDEVFTMLRDEGLENVFARHERMAKMARAGAGGMGLSLFADPPAASVTTVNGPEGVDTGKLVARLRDRYGVTMVGGQEQAKGKIFRIAHLGYYDDLDIIVALGAVEAALRDLGYAAPAGGGVAAAIEEMRA